MTDKSKAPWIFEWDEPVDGERPNLFYSYVLNERGDYDAEDVFCGLEDLAKKMEKVRTGQVTVNHEDWWWLAAERFYDKWKKVDKAGNDVKDLLLTGPFREIFEDIPVHKFWDYYEQVLVSFLYQLGNDHFTLSLLDELLRDELAAHRDEEGGRKLIAYPNKHLHAWAKEWAQKLMKYPQKEDQ